MLQAARVVLTDEQFTNGYLPDFRGNREGRVPIPETAVNTLKGYNLQNRHSASIDLKSNYLEAVRLRFDFKEVDMNTVWSSLRTSLVQKVTDLKKKTKNFQQQNHIHGSSRNLTEHNSL